MIDVCANQFGKIDIICNNAGISGQRVKTHEYSIENFDRVLNINLKGPLYGIKHVIPHFLNNNGGTIMRYMGHACLESTFYYLHLVPEFFSTF